MPALPLDEAGKYVAAAYIVFLGLILVYVAIMATKLTRIERDLTRARRARRTARAPARRGARDRMSELLLLGTSHKTAPLALRERIALPERRAERFLAELKQHPEIREAVVVSTCNRTELYVVVSDPVEAETTVLGMFARQAGLRPTELIEAIYDAPNCDAARHLYRVTSGLESMIVGEAEVQGQVKRAYEAALGARATGPLTNKLFRAALATGKRVRTETAIGAGGASVASVAVEAARDALGGGLGSRRVLIIGAGETAELTARALQRAGRGHDVRRQPAAGAGDRARAALRRRHDRLRRHAGRARAGRHRRRLDDVAALPGRRGGARARDDGARRAAAAAARPRGAARHRPGVRHAARRDARRHRRPAGPGRAHAPRAASSRRAGPRGSSRRRSRRSRAGSGRSRCCRRSARCGRGPTGWSRSCSRRTRRASRR